ncbi:cation/H(+) antiporter [Microbacterium sp. Gd 4-13]|uniref:cation:proton antiporter n=1 Tax=Microbacterium sp. Gd 4-13 TaxID=2173179 RepID=UPI000D588120|nr:cation:proton antiporter [Microbacterium sp. Gd 4-13]PVW04177.1 cation/H(+) antiporter [Microbacterium sp. Gd 4-13]
MALLDAGFFLLPLLAVLAPLAARGLGRWVRVPIVVFELALGIIVGPSVLGWIAPSDIVGIFASFGLAMLFFMAGNEIDFAALRGRSGARAGAGWVLSLAAGLGVGWLVAPGEPAVFIGIALASTALGALMPILRDAGELGTPWGRAVTAVGAVGEFGPLVAISLFLGTRDVGAASIVLGVFVVIAAGAVFVAARFEHGRIHRLVNATLHTSGQMAVRIVFLIVGALVALSIALQLDMLLGAFVAGVLWKLVMRNARPPLREAVDSKVEAVAFGFLVPVFFLYTGITFDLQAMVSSPRTIALVPLFLVALLVVRGIPASFVAPAGSSQRDRVALGMLGATALPIVVAVTGIGVADGTLDAGTAAALVGAAMLSVLLYPFLGMAIRGDRSVVTKPAFDPVVLAVRPATRTRRADDADEEGGR